MYCISVKGDDLHPSCLDSAGWIAFISGVALIPKFVTRATADGVLKACGGVVEESEWPLAILRLFLARGDVPTDVDALVQQFKAFVQTAIVPYLPDTMLPPLLVAFNSGAVQDIARVHREPLRKIFADIATREDVPNAPPRLRLSAFIALCRELRVSTEISEASKLFAACRLLLYAADGAANLPGVGFLGFTGCMFLCSQVRLGGNPLVPSDESFKTFLTSSVFPHFQARLKLRW
jgi:hypothetical protein